MTTKASNAAPLSPSLKELLREFLQGAPEELSEWAAAQQLLLDADVATATGTAKTTAEDLNATESDDFYNDMEDDDDVLQRRKPKAKTASPDSVSTRGVLKSGGAKIALVAALGLGAAFGIWYAGKEPAPIMDAGTTTMTTGTSENADPLRQIELEQQVKENPDDIDAQLELGVLYFNQGQVTLAAEHWEAATELDPENITAWYNLGFARLSQDPADMQGAQQAWQKVVDIDPDSELAQTVVMHLDNVGGAGQESGG